MKKLMLVLVSFFIVHSVALANDDVPIPVSQLPAAARKFVLTHFAQSEISYAKMEKNLLDKSYGVVFESGDKLEFNSKGNWTEVDCKSSASFPEAIIPKEIKDYVTKNHPHARIVKIEREKRHHEVELSNGIELKFNKEYKVVDIDD